MAETIFEHIDGKDTWTVSTDERIWRNKLAKLAEQYPESVQAVAINADNSVMYRFPAKWLRVRPSIKRTLTSEQKAELAERMKKVRKDDRN